MCISNGLDGVLAPEGLESPDAHHCTHDGHLRGEVWGRHGSGFWVLVKGFNLNYHNKATMLYTIDPYYGNQVGFSKRKPIGIYWRFRQSQGFLARWVLSERVRKPQHPRRNPSLRSPHELPATTLDPIQLLNYNPQSLLQVLEAALLCMKL